MKKYIGWGVFAGFLLIIGGGILNSKIQPLDGEHRSRLSSAENSANKIDDTGLDHVIVSSNDVSLDAPNELERQSMLANGNVEHKQLVKREGKHPNRVLIETLQRDRNLKKFIPIGRTEMVADHVLVRLREDVSYDQLDQLALQHNASVQRVLADGSTYLLKLEAPTLDAVQSAIAFFSAAATEVAYAEPDYVRHFSKIPNDLMYGDLWSMPKISAPSAWDITTGSKDVVVAVIDSGMDMDHPDLISNRWNNDAEIPGDDLDNDGNGYVDDVNGWDFVAEDNDPEDADGHGTHCAGTVGAVGNNANQVVGVCWDVSLMPIRIGTSEGILDSDIVDGIRYAARNGAKVLSNSYGAEGFSQTIYDAISFANDLGSIFVTSAGNTTSDNDTQPHYPASYDLPNIISVAATDENDELATFSNYGATSVDLAAPGVDIISTYLNGETSSLQGTSFACSQVAGAMALLVSTDPTITPEEAKTLLLASVDPIVSLTGKVVTGGRLNLQAIFINANDADGDGMPDSWETLYGLNPNDSSDALLDGDGDFLTNVKEFQNGCVPTDSDSDNDSLIDGWEILYGFNPVDVHGQLPRLQYLGFSSDVNDVYDVVIEGGYAYVADGANGLKILDLTEPENPILVGSYATSGSAQGVDVEGGYAYVVDATQGLFIIDVSDPSDPVLEGSLASPSVKVEVGGGFAYLAATSNGLRVINITTPASPFESASFTGNDDPDFMVNDIALAGGSVFMALKGGLGQVSPSATGYSIQPISDGNGNENCTSIFYNGSELYVTLQNHGVLTYNLAKTLLGGTETPGTAEDVVQSEGIIYVADGTKGLQIYNGTDLANISGYASYANIPAYAVTVANGYAYIAGKSAGLQIFRSSVDSDSDGMYDSWEIQHFGTLIQSAFDDFDSDGIVNWGEYLANLNPTISDQDSDTLIDGFDEVQTYLTDPRKADTDDDGLTDVFEVTTNNVDNFFFTDPLMADTDGDGMADKWEIENGLNPLVDDSDLDADVDGATNLEEQEAGTDPQDSDSDNDLMPDGWEIDKGLDPLVNDAADDDDSDTFSNLVEYNHLINNSPYFESTHPKKADSDDDGLTDSQEINTYLTDPNNPDTDGDGMPDAWEIDNGLNPLLDDSVGDLDGDGLSNYEEYVNGSDPFNTDSDSDGFRDDWEREWGTSATNAADPLVVDDDHPDDPQSQDPLWSNTNENGSATAPFDAIQEAINVASNGVTILVMEGLYDGAGNFDIDPLGKELVIRSHGGASNTVITSYGIGAGFIFRNDETTNTVLRGFSITTTLNACSDGDCDQRHGIICDAASPLIRDCIVYESELRGISCTFGASPVISNCVISTCLYGIYAEEGATPIILDTTVALSGNHAEFEDSGLGITALDSDGLIVSNCFVYGSSGRGIHIRGDSAAQISDTVIENNLGGASLDNSSPDFTRCVFRGNIAPDYITINGAVVLSSVNQAVNCTTLDGWDDIANEDENGGAVLSLRNSFPYFENCLVTGNRTVAIDPEYPENKVTPEYGLGGGIYVGTACESVVVNCTIADNSAFTRGGGFSNIGGGINGIFNSIVWGNDAFNHYLTDLKVLSLPSTNKSYTYPSLHCRSGSISVSYSDIEYGYAGSHNIDADPLFTGGDSYRLDSGSQCVDSGGFFYQKDPTSQMVQSPNHDIEGLDRPLDGDGDGTEYPDMGAFEFINLSADTDNDGMPDSWELVHGLNLLVDDSVLDPDADGLTNLEEYDQLNGIYAQSTDPNDADSDGDELSDGDEVNIHGTNPNDPDTDGDGLTDKWEVDNGLDPLSPSSGVDDDNDGASNFVESQNGTDPFDPDSDDDNIPDGWEIDNALNPLVNDAAGDPDNDTLTNLEEYNLLTAGTYLASTNPNKSDSDDDGLTDAEEINPIVDTDPNNADTDGDGMPDGWELDRGLDPLVDDAGGHADGDGISNYEEYLNGTNPSSNDTDNDGFEDDVEWSIGSQATNSVDPIVVDDDHPADPQAYDPMYSNPDEDGSLQRPFDGIQEAIDVAVDGMLVLVTNGYYIGQGNMNIDTKGKAIRIESWNGMADTIIDADGLGAAFIFQSGESNNTVISGFTITSPPGGCADGSCGYEHGIVCADASSPTITNCTIIDCALSGIDCSNGSSPIIEAVAIDGCGVGIRTRTGASPRIIQTTVSNCSLGINAIDSEGLQVVDSIISDCGGRGITVFNDSSCRITGSQILNNLGGITFSGSSPLVDQCVIQGNIAPDYYSAGRSTVNIALHVATNQELTDTTNQDENGAGILLLNNSVLSLENTVLAQNNAVASDPDYPETKLVPDYGLGGGLYIDIGCSSTNMNCTYGDNEARRGGGISSHGENPDYIRNTVLWGNVAEDKYVDSYSYSTTNMVVGGIEDGVTNFVPNIENFTTNILYIVDQPTLKSLHCRDGAFDIWYSDIENGGAYIKPYKYVIEQDPLLTAGYELSAASPCIDVGTSYLAPSYDLDGIARPLDGDNDGSVKHDLGAYEYVHITADSDGDNLSDQDEINILGTDPTSLDTDGDGMSDGFEFQYGLNALGNDANADADGDGLSNLAESGNGTDPTNEDTDGDNSPDGDEDIAGTNPVDSGSYFYVSNIEPFVGGGCDITFDTVSGRTYTVYFSSELGGPWQVLLAGLAGNGSPAVISDPGNVGSSFYKVEVSN